MMIIYDLDVRNFRCFSSRHFEFAPHFNLLVGENGSGKTALLDALAVVAELAIYGMNRGFARLIQPSDCYLSTDNNLTLTSNLPVELSFNYVFDTKRYSQKFSFLGGDPGKTLRKPSISRDVDNALKLIERGNEVTLPIVAYYRAGRLHAIEPNSSIRMMNPSNDRLRGYDGCLDGMTRDGLTLNWLKERLAESPDFLNAELFSIIHEVAHICIPEFKTFDTTFETVKLILVLSDKLIPINAASDGIKSVLTLVIDIASRAYTLNPQFKRDAAKLTPGVVLIDELDLHLHPKMQRTIIDSLRTAFPKMQFFASSHSPFLIQSLKARELVNLNGQSEYQGGSIEDIIEYIMGIEMPSRSDRHMKMMLAARKYYQLLQKRNVSAGDLREIKNQLDELLLPFSDDIAFISFLQMKREAAGFGGDQ